LSKNQWLIILGAGHYETFRGERVLVVIRFNATFLLLRPYCEKICTTLERCRKSKNVWLHAMKQSDCLYSSLFFGQYNCSLLC